MSRRDGCTSYTRMTQLGNTTSSTVQTGEVRRRGRPKKVEGGKELRIKKVKDLGLRIGMVVKIAAKDGSIVEGTVLRRTTKKTGKLPNNFDVRDNTNSEVMKDVNFDRVHWFIEDDAENTVENVCQVTEEEVHEIFATVIGKERHDEEGVIEAKKRELESIKSYGTYEEVWS